jgi:uncharacterized protein
MNAYNIEAISIGNGTASRETEFFINSFDKTDLVLYVSEAGASVYSASKLHDEFPNYDVTVRGSVSLKTTFRSIG